MGGVCGVGGGGMGGWVGEGGGGRREGEGAEEGEGVVVGGEEEGVTLLRSKTINGVEVASLLLWEGCSLPLSS